MNELVDIINAVIDRSVKDMNNPKIRFVNPDPLFDGHRFCEKGHDLDAQFFLKDVWFWLWNPPSEDPDYEHQRAWIQDAKFPNGTVAGRDYLESVVGISSASALRIFHPKGFGNFAIKNLLIQRFWDDKVPGVKQPAIPTPPTQQPYASGQARLHVREFKDCNQDPQVDLSVEVEIWDSTGSQIGFHERTQAGAVSPGKIGSKFEDQLIVTPEHGGGDYIQFQLGQLNFNSIQNAIECDEKKHPRPWPETYCCVGGWDPKGGPQCVIPGPGGGPPRFDLDAVSIRQMDCWFPAVSSHLSKFMGY